MDFILAYSMGQVDENVFEQFWNVRMSSSTSITVHDRVPLNINMATPGGSADQLLGTTVKYNVYHFIKYGKIRFAHVKPA